MARGKTATDFSHSMTDLMTSLAVIVILLLVVYISRSYRVMKQALDEAQNSSKAIKVRLLGTLKQLHLPAEEDPNDPLALIIRIRADELQFAVNRSELSTAGKQYLKKFMPSLIEALSNSAYKKDVNSLLIEGHTDSDGNDELNLRLSQDRAFEVLRCSLNETGLNLGMREYLLLIASTNGRGERDLMPQDVKEGFENKAQSRRVEFRIRIKSYEQKRKVTNNLSPAASEARGDENITSASKTPVETSSQ